MSRRLPSIAFALIGAFAIGAAATPAQAQVIGLQGVYVPPSGGRRASFGGAADIGYIGSHGPLGIWGAIGAEYQRQRDNGPGRGRVSADLRFLPVRIQTALVPFIGGSVSANRSGGKLSEWPGTRTGLDALAGLLYVASDRSKIALSIQERFGYVVGMPHAFATEVGLRFPLH